MPTLLQIDFPLSGPWGDEMAEAFGDLGLTSQDRRRLGEATQVRNRAGSRRVDHHQIAAVAGYDHGRTSLECLADHPHQLGRIDGRGPVQHRRHVGRLRVP